MIWVAVILGILTVAFTLVTIAVIALKMLQNASEVSQTFVEAHSRTLAALERTHERNVAQNSSVLDRFMSLDFALFKSYQSAEFADEGSFIDPDEDEGSVIRYNAAGSPIDTNGDISRRLQQAIDEAKLISEDFGEDFDQVEGLAP